MLPSKDPPLPKEKSIASQYHRLRSGNLYCIYENGFIRKLSSAGKELVSCIYPALRDQHWQTAPSVISEEVIDQQPDGFKIRYRADYSLNDIRYTAFVSISCMAGTGLVFSFDGTANSEFLRNRIGLCVLLPPESLRGKRCFVGHPGGNNENILFPKNIHPVQPFLNIRSLRWEATDGIHVNMEFAGDIFEAEDQRNWGDASYKIYSTPHELPLPVAVQRGDKVRQEIRLSCSGHNSDIDFIPFGNAPVVFHTGGPSFPFPGLGLSYNPDAQTPQGETIRLLRRLGTDHYRIELFYPDEWKSRLKEGCSVAAQLGATLQVAFFIGAADPAAALGEFLSETFVSPGLVSALIVFAGQGPVARVTDLTVSDPEMIRRLQGFRRGSGTDSFFAHWNQQPAIPQDPGDFISFPVCPQVHLRDSRTMAENLPAMTDIIETAKIHSPDTAIFAGPVTLKMRYNPDAISLNNPADRFPYNSDARQQSLFAAGWAAMALRYLCRADKITLFEITGDRGLMPSVPPEPGLAAVRVFPVYLVLREISAFKPKRILLSRSLRPADVDGLVLENAQGDRLMLFCNFTQERQTLQLKTESWKALPLFGKSINGGAVSDLLEDGEKFRSAPYNPILLSEGNMCRIAPETILFLTTLQDWSFG